MALSEKLIDKRVLRRSLERGLVDEAEFENHLASLPDLSGQVEDGPGEPAVPEASPPLPPAPHDFQP
ncbi:MAG: hypothetical protein OXU20_03000 [Myxococcales bacterium]|nr:hypothetical protein [Myxococcales bacterium]MDD9965523.1 hypothetical protein [Myxococcales bacterium]